MLRAEFPGVGGGFHTLDSLCCLSMLILLLSRARSVSLTYRFFGMYPKCPRHSESENPGWNHSG